MEAKLKDGSILHVNSEERIYALSLSDVSMPLIIDHVEGERILIEYAEQQQKEIAMYDSVVAEDNDTKKRLLEIIDRYEELALEHHYQTILDEME